MTCRGCGPSPDPEQDREHNDWCPDNPRRAHRDKDDIPALLDEIERLRAALRDIARGDYSDPLCQRTPEQRARDALKGATP